MTTLSGDEPDLELGASGDYVVQLQDRLRGMGLLDKFPDGTYDDQTETAVRQLQSTVGQSGDGRVGQETWQALDQRMLDQGLYYNPYAGPGQQHWDFAEQPIAHEAAHVAQQSAAPVGQQTAQAEPYWDGQQWLQWDARTGEWLPMADGTQSSAAVPAEDAAVNIAADAAWPAERDRRLREHEQEDAAHQADAERRAWAADYAARRAEAGDDFGGTSRDGGTLPPDAATDQ